MNEIKCPGDCTDTGCCAPKKPQPVIIEFLCDEKDDDLNKEVWSVLERAVKNVTAVLNSSGLYIETIRTTVESSSNSGSLPLIKINDRVSEGSEYTEKLLMSAVIEAVYSTRMQQAE